MSPVDPSPSEHSGTRRTASKATLSCKECRRMKFRCDRSFPCVNCVRRGLGDICPNGQLEKGARYVVKEDVDLKKRVEELETALACAHLQLKTLSRLSPLSEGPGNVRGLGHSLPSPLPAVATQLTGPTADTAWSLTEQGQEEKEEPGGQLVLGDDSGSSQFFRNAGPIFIYNVQSASCASDDGHLTGKSGSNPFPSSTMHPIPGLPYQSSFDLEAVCGNMPSLQAVQDLAHTYFEYGSFPYRPVTHDDFDMRFLPHIFNEDGSRKPPNGIHGETLNPQIVAIIFVVIAIGAQVSTRSRSSGDSAETYFMSGRLALALDPTCSIYLIQCIHMMSRFVGNCATSPTRCPPFWATLGSAIRGAQMLGLHRDGERWGLSQDEAELRRRTFWEIYYEDQVQSLTQGRPRLIADFTIDAKTPRVPSPYDLDALFHEWKYRAVRITAKVNDLQSRVAPTPYRMIIEIDQENKTLEKEIPESLRWAEGQGRGRGLLRYDLQKVTLRSFLMSNALSLHRTHFVRALRDYPQDPLQSVYQYSFLSELEAGRVLLEALRDVLNMDLHTAGRFWIFFYHAFNAIATFAATVISSPTCSLAQAIFVHIEDGVKLFESVPAEYIESRGELPVLRKLLEAARQAITSHIPNGTGEILAVGVGLHRLPPLRQGLQMRPAFEPDDDQSSIQMTNPMFSPFTDMVLPSTVQAAMADEQLKILNASLLSDEVVMNMPNFAAGFRPAAFGEREADHGSQEIFDFDAFMAEFCGTPPESG